MKYTAILKQAEGWWVGWVVEIPGVNAQEKTKARLIESLQELVREALEFDT